MIKRSGLTSMACGLARKCGWKTADGWPRMPAALKLPICCPDWPLGISRRIRSPAPLIKRNASTQYSRRTAPLAFLVPRNVVSVDLNNPKN